jgi:hypothetical protein
MIYTIKLQDDKVRLAAAYVNLHHKDRKFLERVRAVDKYNHTNIHPIDVGNMIEFNLRNYEIDIVGYKPLNPWSKAIGYAKGKTIYINERKSFDIFDRAETIFHETMHILGFSHKGNFVTEYNLKTVPYLTANIFVNYLKEIYGNDYILKA